jgi:hypothetical protein
MSEIDSSEIKKLKKKMIDIVRIIQLRKEKK